MMNNPTRRLALAAALVFLALVPAAIIVAQEATPAPQGSDQAGPPPGMPGGRGRMGGPPPAGGGLALERLSSQLGLSDSQKSSIDALLAAERQTLRVEMDSLRQARQALDAAVMNVPVDDGLLQAQVQQLSAIEAQVALAQARTQAKIFQLLNGEQQSRARQLIMEAEQRGPRRGGRG